MKQVARPILRVFLISLAIFGILLIILFSSQATETPTESSSSSATSSENIISDVLDKQLNSLTNPFKSAYYETTLAIPVRYVDGYNVKYIANSKYVVFNTTTKTVDVKIPTYGEITATVSVSVSLDGIVKTKYFQFYLFGETQLCFNSYFESEGKINTISIRNNSDTQVDLSRYIIKVLVNGDKTYVPMQLSGKLEAGEKLYFSTDSLVTPGINYFSTYIFDFDGSDVIQLYDKDILIDVIGRSGLDMSNRSIYRNEDVELPMFGFNEQDYTDYYYNINFFVDGEFFESLKGLYTQNVPQLTMVKEGYTFSGFYKDILLTKPYNYGTFDNENIDVYGKWIKN